MESDAPEADKKAAESGGTTPAVKDATPEVSSANTESSTSTKTETPPSENPNTSASASESQTEKPDAPSETPDAGPPAGESGAPKSDGVAATPESAKPAESEIKPHIVFVDDDTMLCESAKKHFSEKNYTIQIYSSKEQINEKPFDHTPAMLVMDIDLSGEDGRSLALDLLDSGKLSKTIIVLLTDTEMDKATVEFTLKLGFRKVVRKPVSFPALERILLDEPRRKGEKIAKKTIVVEGPPAEARADDESTPRAEDEADAARAQGDEHHEETQEDSNSTKPVVKTSGVAQAMKTAMTMPSVKGGASTATAPAAKAPEKPAEAPVVHAPAHKPAPRPRQAPATLSEQSRNIQKRGIIFGLLFSVLTGAGLAFGVSKGYAHSYMILEGIVIGLAAGIGASTQWKKSDIPLNASVVMFFTAVMSIAGWATLLILRAVLNAPFVERTEAMLKFSREHPEHVREWGTSESTALAFIIGQLIVTFIVASVCTRSSSQPKNRL